MQKIIKLQPIFKEKIWGGKRLSLMYNYKIPSNKTGECWAISAHKNGDNVIENGTFKGNRLSEIYDKHRYLFANIKSETFPLLSKIIDASDDLSVQVHPNDDQALKYDEALGKTECWYILSAEEGAEIIYGHNAATKTALKEYINSGKWNDLLRTIKVKKGDFFYVPAGTLHAIGKGITILEIQQSSDTTFRVYDYDRIDQNNELRELHINESIEVTKAPHIDPKINSKTIIKDGFVKTDLIEAEYFNVSFVDITNQASFDNSSFQLVNVLEGACQLNGERVKKGDHFIVTSLSRKVNIAGKCKLMVSSPGDKVLNH